MNNDSNDKPQAEPREFFFEFNGSEYGQLNDQPISQRTVGFEVVHVIEKSAYDALKAERDDALCVAAGIEEQAKKNSDYDEWRIAKLRDEVEELQSQKPVPLCIVKHTAGIGYTSTLDSENCIVCKETEDLELLAESYRAMLLDVGNRLQTIENLARTYEERNYPIDMEMANIEGHALEAREALEKK